MLITLWLCRLASRGTFRRPRLFMSCGWSFISLFVGQLQEGDVTGHERLLCFAFRALVLNATRRSIGNVET